MPRQQGTHPPAPTRPSSGARPESGEPSPSWGSRARRGSQPCLTGRVTAGGESAPQCSVQRIRMRPARCWWAICDCDPHRAASPSPGAEHLLRAEAGRGQASCGAGLCWAGPVLPCSAPEGGALLTCLSSPFHRRINQLIPRGSPKVTEPELKPRAGHHTQAPGCTVPGLSFPFSKK